MSTLEKTFALILLALSMLAIYLLSPILTPFIVGIILAYLGDPLVDRLENLKINRTLGALIVFLGFAVLLTLGLLILIPMLVGEVAALIRDIPTYVTWLQRTTSPLLIETFGIDPFDFRLDSLKERVTENWKETGGLVGRILSEVTASGMVLLATIMNIALTPVVAFYLMRDWDDVVQRLREMIPRDKEVQSVRLVQECDEVLSSFLRGQLLVMVALGCIYSIGLTMIGLKLALLIGMMAGLLSIVPYLGSIIGIVAALIAAFFQFQDWIHPVYVVIVFMFGQAIEGMVLTPWLVGDRIGLHPVAVIFAVLAGGQLFGFIGILLALPVAAVVMVFVRHLHLSYLQSHYYSDNSAN